MEYLSNMLHVLLIHPSRAVLAMELCSSIPLRGEHVLHTYRDGVARCIATYHLLVDVVGPPTVVANSYTTC